jgi:hypothetical protein
MCTFDQSRFGTTVAGNTSGLPADELWGMVSSSGWLGGCLEFIDILVGGLLTEDTRY